MTSADGVPLHAVRWRSPRPGTLRVVVLPGFWRRADSPGTRRICRELARHREVWTLDFRGHGRSGGRYCFGDAEAADLSALLAVVPPGPVAVVGLSMGGRIAVNLLAEGLAGAGRVSSLAMVATPDDLGALRPRLGLDLLRQITPADLIRPPRVALGALRKPRPRTADLLTALDLPLAILHHDRDWLVSFRHAETIIASGRGRRLLVPFRGGGRYHADALARFLPERFFAALEGWLSSVHPTAGKVLPWNVAPGGA